jgi:hypothetical protein
MDESNTYTARIPGCGHAGTSSIGPALLARIDTSAGCSIKDSFASLDMTAYGFRVLFDAQWILHRGTAIPPIRDGSRWEVVRDGDGLAAWERAWRGNDGPPGVFRTEILDHDSVSVLALTPVAALSPARS